MVKRVGKSVDEHCNDAHNKLIKAMEKSMKMVEADAKLLVGVDSGRLRASLTSQVEDIGDKIIGECGTNVEYGFFHALQNPYLETAVDQNLENIRRKIGEVLSK